MDVKRAWHFSDTIICLILIAFLVYRQLFGCSARPRTEITIGKRPTELGTTAKTRWAESTGIRSAKISRTKGRRTQAAHGWHAIQGKWQKTAGKVARLDIVLAHFTNRIVRRSKTVRKLFWMQSVIVASTYWGRTKSERRASTRNDAMNAARYHLHSVRRRHDFLIQLMRIWCRGAAHIGAIADPLPYQTSRTVLAHSCLVAVPNANWVTARRSAPLRPEAWTVQMVRFMNTFSSFPCSFCLSFIHSYTRTQTITRGVINSPPLHINTTRFFVLAIILWICHISITKTLWQIKQYTNTYTQRLRRIRHFVTPRHIWIHNLNHKSTYICQAP